jgi:hypothetical protein
MNSYDTCYFFIPLCITLSPCYLTPRETYMTQIHFLLSSYSLSFSSRPHYCMRIDSQIQGTEPYHFNQVMLLQGWILLQDSQFGLWKAEALRCEYPLWSTNDSFITYTTNLVIVMSSQSIHYGHKLLIYHIDYSVWIPNTLLHFISPFVVQAVMAKIEEFYTNDSFLIYTTNLVL